MSISISSKPPAASAAGGAAAPGAAAAPVSWRRCQNHPQVRAEAMCPNCKVGYCSACGERVQRAVVCPACDGLCIKTEQYEQELRRDAQRSRNLFEDLGTILAYPLRDPVSYLLLALFTWIFGVAARVAIYGGILGLLLSQGVLMWYAFTALTRVANGNLKDSMPEFRDIWDTVRAFLLPLLAATCQLPGPRSVVPVRRATARRPPCATQ